MRSLFSDLMSITLAATSQKRYLIINSIVFLIYLTHSKDSPNPKQSCIEKPAGRI